MIARGRLVNRIDLLLIALALVFPAAAQADFGVAGVSTAATNKDGTLDLRAGTHPYEYTVSVAMNQNSSHEAEGTLRNLVVNLPRGLVGNPLAVPRCGRAQFEGAEPQCPDNTAIGVAHAHVGNLLTSNPIYNLVPPPGVPASFGFSVIELSSYQSASVRSGGDYGVTITDDTIPTSLEIRSISETIWGVPAESSHDAERGACATRKKGSLCPSDAAPRPFLTLPTSCSGPLQASVQAESLQDPGVLTPPVSAFSLDAGGSPTGLTACEQPAFEPSVTVQPEVRAADSPTGLAFDLHVPQNEAPEGLATANVQDTVVSLPAGLTVNPSAGDGLAGCAESQIALNSPEPARCPGASKIGSVQIHAPLLENPLPGSVYLAKQGENPFDSLLALYIAVYDPVSGVVVKLPGKVTPDPVTGQLTATFDENPQLPFEDLEVNFFGGPRATLTTPPTCGAYTTNTDLTPWTTPAGADARPSDRFQIASGANGAGCATSESQLPNSPSFEAGTTAPLAGSYSPFVLKVSRENGSQRLQAVNVVLPSGLTGKLAGVAECSDAAIAAASARHNPGEGALEQAYPSCPQASEVGVVTVGAGSGSPLYVQGHAYLAGPYKGAPLSLAIITPAVAGPFDLGNVVVRSALYVNPETAQITVKSDPIPTILQGIPLDVRSIAVKLGRPNFTLNPTSCEAMSISGEAISTLGNVAPLTNRFQVGGCKGLDFAPKLALRVFGKTNRNAKPRFRAVVQTKPGEANIARAQVNLPHSEFLEQNHIKEICTRIQFNAGQGHGQQCPKSSIYGKAKAWSSLLEAPLEGPVHLRSNGGERKLPDLVAALNGQIDIDLWGKVDSGPNEGIRNTFEVVPDAPVSKFILEMKGGKKGLLVNSENLCSKHAKAQAIVRFTGQNGKVESLKPRVANSCGGKAKKTAQKRKTGK